MLNYIYAKFGSLKPVVIDGFLYVCIAMFGSIIGLMSTDEVYKYMNPYAVFYIKALSSIGLAGVSALKMFRSTSYSDHQADKKAASSLQNGNTEIITRESVQVSQQLVTGTATPTPTIKK